MTTILNGCQMKTDLLTIPSVLGNPMLCAGGRNGLPLPKDVGLEPRPQEEGAGYSIDGREC